MRLRVGWKSENVHPPRSQGQFHTRTNGCDCKTSVAFLYYPKRRDLNRGILSIISAMHSRIHMGKWESHTHTHTHDEFRLYALCADADGAHNQQSVVGARSLYIE